MKDKTIVLHPRHGWRRCRIDRSGLWPVVTFAFWTVEFVAQPADAKVIEVLTELRRR